MKVSELMGAQLDAWVARALGKERVIVSDGRACQVAEIAYLPPGFVMHGALPEYSKDWAAAGPIIEREKIDTSAPDEFSDDDRWFAGMWQGKSLQYMSMRHEARGDTPLIAAMRCFVSSKFGDTVPDE